MPNAKPLYFSGSMSAAGQHLGVYHAAAQNFDPAFALADAAALAMAGKALDIDLGGGFGEGEVVRTEAHDGIFAVQALDDRFQAALEVAHGDALINDQALDLMEDGGVGGIHGIAAVHTAGGDDADGGLAAAPWCGSVPGRSGCAAAPYR